MWDKTTELHREIEDKRHSGSFSSQGELYKALGNLGAIALEEGLLYDALNAYMELNDRDNVRLVGERCLTDTWLHDANRAFEYLGDRSGILRVIEATEAKEEGEYALETVLSSYLGGKTIKRTHADFQEWAKEQGIDDAYGFEVAKAANMAYHKAGDYDVGVGVARGGLFTAYIFSRFGLDMKTAQAHRRGKGATFNWVSDVNQKDFEGKNVVVFDKDVVTGRSTKRVLRELQKLRPEKIDLVLNHNPCKPYGIGSLIQNVPEGYNEVFYPNKFSYKSFDKVVQRLEQGK